MLLNINVINKGINTPKVSLLLDVTGQVVAPATSPYVTQLAGFSVQQADRLEALLTRVIYLE